MRKNLSEELEINDDISLDNGEDKKPEEEKVANELKDIAQKDLDDKNKIADEIREAEAPEAEANDGYGKSLKIKQFVEKLTLEEPTNVLNEDFDDFLFEKRSDAVHAVYGILESYMDNLMTTDIDILEECESVCEEALVHLEDAIKSGEY